MESDNSLNHCPMLARELNFRHARFASHNFEHMFWDLSIAAVSYFILGKRLGSLSSSGDVSPDSQEFITTVGKLFSSLTDLLFALPLYQLYRTKLWKSIASTNVQVHKLARKFINEKLAEIEQEDRKALEEAGSEEEAPDKVDFLTYVVHSGKMSIEQVTVNVVDLLSAGVETVSACMFTVLQSFSSKPVIVRYLHKPKSSYRGRKCLS